MCSLSVSDAGRGNGMQYVLVSVLPYFKHTLIFCSADCYPCMLGPRPSKHQGRTLMFVIITYCNCDVSVRPG